VLVVEDEGYETVLMLPVAVVFACRQLETLGLYKIDDSM
jgi:hypothetical protein